MNELLELIKEYQDKYSHTDISVQLFYDGSGCIQDASDRFNDHEGILFNSVEQLMKILKSE